MGWNKLDMGTGTGPQCWAWAEETTLLQGRAAGTPQPCAQAGAANGAHGPQGRVGPWREVCVCLGRQWVLTPAAVSCGIPVEAGLALGAVGPCSVVEAAQALPCAPVTCLRVRHVNVIVALAGQAAPTLQRIPIVPRGTFITAGTC